MCYAYSFILALVLRHFPFAKVKHVQFRDGVGEDNGARHECGMISAFKHGMWRTAGHTGGRYLQAKTGMPVFLTAASILCEIPLRTASLSAYCYFQQVNLQGL